MAQQYTLTLESEEDYQIIRKLLKAFKGASIRPLKKSNIEKALEEIKEGKISGPYMSVKELMEDLLN